MRAFPFRDGLVMLLNSVCVRAISDCTCYKGCEGLVAKGYNSESETLRLTWVAVLVQKVEFLLVTLANYSGLCIGDQPC